MQHLQCALTDIKLASDSDTMTLVGYAAIFDNIDGHGDMILPGAFADTLRDIKKTGIWPSLLMQHGGMGISAEDLMPIGVITDLAEDGHGLALEATLADIPRGRDTYTLLKMSPRPALNGLSIGYRPKEWTLGTKPKEPRRTLKKIDLIEVSLVTFPANPRARISSVKSDPDNIRIAEQALRDVGYSQREAKTILANGFKALSGDLRDVEATEELAELRKALMRRGAALT